MPPHAVSININLYTHDWWHIREMAANAMHKCKFKFLLHDCLYVNNSTFQMLLHDVCQVKSTAEDDPLTSLRELMTEEIASLKAEIAAQKYQVDSLNEKVLDLGKHILNLNYFA